MLDNIINFIIVLGLVFWFFDKWQKNRTKVKEQRNQLEFEERQLAQDIEYWKGLRAKRDAGDEEAAKLLEELGIK
jgi:hypothetical protein